MKTIIRSLTVTFLSACVASSGFAAGWTEGMKQGTPSLKSMGPLAFGPDGILFIADTKGAAIVAIAMTDSAVGGSGTKVLKVEGINQKIAGMLGTSAEQVLIDAMAVNPLSRNVYLAASRGRGPNATPVLMRVTTDGKIEMVSLENVKYSTANLPDAPVEGVQGEGNRQSN